MNGLGMRFFAVVLALAVRGVCSLEAGEEGMDPIQTLTGIRDKLRADLAGKVAQDRSSTTDAPRTFLLRFEQGGITRGPMDLMLHRLGGAWSAPDVRSPLSGVELQEVDVSALVLESNRVSGSVGFLWTVATDKDQNERVAIEDDRKSQTFEINAKVVANDPRLVLTCHRFVNNTLVLRFKPGTERGTWQIESAPKPLVLDYSFGRYRLNVPDLKPDADGRFSIDIEFTQIRDSKMKTDSEDTEFNKLGKPKLTLDGRIQEGRVDSIWTCKAPGGKHLFGSGQDVLTGAVEAEALEGEFTAKGDKGEWRGALKGTVLPAPQSLSLLDRLVPKEVPTDPAGRAKHGAGIYRQICILDHQLRYYPSSLQDAINRLIVPEPVPQDPSVAGVEAYLSTLAILARDAGATPVQAPSAGLTRPPDETFGPFFKPQVLSHATGESNRVGAVGTGPQAWGFLAGWQMIGPFGLVEQDVDVVRPELLPVAGITYKRARLFTNASTDKRLPPEVEMVEDLAGWIPAFVEDGRVAGPSTREASAGDMRYFMWYARNEIQSDVDQKVWLAMRIQGQAWLWVNDVLTWVSGPRVDKEYVPAVFEVALRKGVNRLLVRCASSKASNEHCGRVDWFDGFGPRPQGRMDFTTFQMHVCTAGQPGSVRDPAVEAAAAVEGPVGYRRDGSGVYADAQPPLAWDWDKGINIAWRTPLPGGVADPVVRDAKVFVTADPHHLICLDAATGKELWKATPSILETLGENKWKSGDVLGDYWVDLAKMEALSSLEMAAPNEEKAALQKKRNELGAKWGEFTAYLKAQRLSLNGNPAAGTPVVGKDRVWVHFGTGVAACYDFAGVRKWMTPTLAPWSGPNMGSPVVADGKFVVQVHLPGEDSGLYALMAFDAETGQKLWTATAGRKRVLSEHDRAAGLGNGVAPVHLRHGEMSKTVLITGDGVIVDLQTGEVILRDVLELEANRQAPCVVGDTAYFTPVIGQSAVKMWLDAAGRVGARTLWVTPPSMGRGQVKTITGFGERHWMKGPVVQGDLIHVWRVDSAHVPQHHPCPWEGLDIYDRLTGQRVTRARGLLREVTDPTVAPALAGGYLFAGDGGDPIRGFDGRFDQGSVAVIKPGKRPVVLVRNKIGTTRSSPVFDGSRAFFRSLDSLTCVAVGSDAGRKYQEERIADTLFVELGERPAAPETVDLSPLPERPAPDAVVVARLVDAYGAAASINHAEKRMTPSGWMFAGPLPVEPGADPLAPFGGKAGAVLRVGDEVKIQDKSCKFEKMDPKFIMGSGTKGIDVIGPINRSENSVTYFYTLIDITAVSTFKFEPKGIGVAFWLAGMPLKGGEHLRLQIGTYPLLVRSQVGKVPPFVKNMYVEAVFRQTADSGNAYRDWVSQVSVQKDLLERVTRELPGSEQAKTAQSYLDHINKAGPVR